MRFHSTHRREFSFELGGFRHTMAPGDEIDVPEQWVYLVASRGLPLTEGPSRAAGAKVARSERLSAVARPAPRPRASVPDEREDDAVDGEAEVPDAGPDDGASVEATATDAAIEQAARAAGLPPAKSRARRG